MKKLRIICFQCNKEKIYTQSLLFNNNWFCSKTCAYEWFQKNCLPGKNFNVKELKDEKFNSEIN